jgi:hypothetical protein
MLNNALLYFYIYKKHKKIRETESQTDNQKQRKIFHFFFSTTEAFGSPTSLISTGSSMGGAGSVKK